MRATRAAQAVGNKTFFSKMMLDDESARVIPDSLITQEAANVITTSTDTTTMTLTYLVYTILRHGEPKQKLIKGFAALPSNPKFDHSESLPYLQNVVQEVVRLHSAVPESLPCIAPADRRRLGKYAFLGSTQVSTQA